MLLFIRVAKEKRRLGDNSNTSHVIVYRLTTTEHAWRQQIQIHLMLLFISALYIFQSYRYNIQIHLMLLFIEIRITHNGKKQRFKYISCYCLSKHGGYIAGQELNSNTSHVIVYLIAYSHQIAFFLIQIHLMLLFIIYRIIFFKSNIHSNTSHVIVYQKCESESDASI